ncbi:serine hydrolase domain-containing protein [Roseovarius faecimaris]|nr:serine hydrolase [Roseovarius faecimaris]
MTQSEPFDTSTHEEMGLMQGFPPPPDKRVTQADGFFAAPQNRWAYQNMRSLWPSREIAPGSTPRALPRKIDPGLSRIEVAREDGSKADFATYLRQSFTDSFTVIKDGAVVHQTMMNGMTPHQPHIMFSCTKSFVGLLTLMAVEQGQMDEAALLSAYVPEGANGGAFDGVTLGQALDMTNAVDYDEDYANPQASIHDYLHVFGTGQPGPRPGLCDYLLSLGAETSRAHGAEFHYATPVTDMVAWALSRATGQSFTDLMSGQLWQPCGMAGPDYILVDGQGAPFTGGGLNATADDMTRFAAMILAGGRVGNTQVVPEAVIAELEAGGSEAAFEAGGEATGRMQEGGWSYRAQWWVRRQAGHEAILAIGVHGQYIYVDRPRGVAIVKQSSQPLSSDPYFSTYNLNAFDAVVERLS